MLRWYGQEDTTGLAALETDLLAVMEATAHLVTTRATSIHTAHVAVDTVMDLAPSTITTATALALLPLASTTGFTRVPRRRRETSVALLVHDFTRTVRVVRPHQETTGGRVTDPAPMQSLPGS